MTKQILGITGGIASGKSLACEYLKTLGWEVIDTDQIARDFVAPGSPLLNEIARHFGSDILKSNQSLDRQALRQLIFENPKERLWLEALMHPAIRTEIANQIAASQSERIIVAIPLLKKREDYPMLQKILMIDTPEDLEIKRVVARDGISEELARTMIAAQPSRKERLTLADYVIVNEGSKEQLFKKMFDLYSLSFA